MLFASVAVSYCPGPCVLWSSVSVLWFPCSAVVLCLPVLSSCSCLLSTCSLLSFLFCTCLWGLFFMLSCFCGCVSYFLSCYLLHTVLSFFCLHAVLGSFPSVSLCV